MTVPRPLAILVRMEIPVLQILISLIFVLVGFEVARRPPQTRRSRWFFSCFFIVLGILLVCLTRIEYRNLQGAEIRIAERGEIIDRLAEALARAQQARLKPVKVEPAVVQASLARETRIVESNRADLQEKYRSLVRKVLTNGPADPGAREQMVIAEAKLKAASSELEDLRRWETSLKGGLIEAGLLKQLQLENQSSEAQAMKDKVVGYFDGAIRSLAEMTRKEARLKGDQCVVQYAGVPADLSAAAKLGRRFKTNVAEIRFDADPRWDFKAEFAEELTPDYEARMNITCKGGILLMRNSGYLVETKVEVFNGPTFDHDGAVGNGARKNIDDSLEKLLGSELNAVEAVKTAR